MKAAEDASDISMVERKRDLRGTTCNQPFTLALDVEKISPGVRGFNAARVSFGTFGMSVGLPLLLYGFGAYFFLLTRDGSFCDHAHLRFPISLIGFALKYAESRMRVREDAVNVRRRTSLPWC